MNNALSLVFFLFVYSCLPAQSTFTNVYSTDKFVRPVQLLRSGNTFFLVGNTQTTRSSVNEQDFHITHCNADGTVDWIKNFDIQKDDHVTTGIITSDNNLLVAGYFGEYLFPDEWAHSFVMKADLNGNPLWTQILSGPFTIDKATGIVETDDGGYMITGFYKDDSSETHFLYLCKLSAGGVQQWTFSYEGFFKTEGSQLLALGNNEYLMVGTSNTAVFLSKVNGSGNIIWAKNYGVTAIPSDVSRTSDGGFLVTGFNPVPFNNDNLWFFKVDQTGEVEFAQNLGALTGVSVFEAPSGNYMIAGNYTGTTDDDGSFLCATNSSGVLQWTKTLVQRGTLRVIDAVSYGSNAVDLVGYASELGFGLHDNTFVVRTGLSDDLQECLEDTGIVTFNSRTINASPLQLTSRSYTINNSAFSIYSYVKTPKEEQPCDTIGFITKITPMPAALEEDLAYFTDITETDEGDYLVMGQAYDSEEMDGLLLVKTSKSTGEVIWSKLLNDTYGELIEPVGNNEFIIGGKAKTGNTDLIKIDADGNIIWNIRPKRTQDATMNIMELSEPSSISVTDDRRYVYVLMVNGGRTFLAKVNIAGDVIWHKTFDEFYAKEAKATRDGGFIVVGHKWNLDWIKTDVIKGDSSGNVQWGKTYTGNFEEDLKGYSSIQVPNGQFIITGYDHSSYMTAIKIDSLGSVLWRKTYGGIRGAGNNLYSMRISALTDSLFVIWNKENVGSSASLNSDEEYLTINSDGKVNNVNTFLDANFIVGSLSTHRVASFRPTRSGQHLLFCGSRNKYAFFVKAKANGYFYCNSSGLSFSPPSAAYTATDTFAAIVVPVTLYTDYPTLTSKTTDYSQEYICGYCEAQHPSADFGYHAMENSAVFYYKSATEVDSLQWIISTVGGQQTILTGDSVIYPYSYNGTYNACMFAKNSCGASTKCRSVNLEPNAIEPTVESEGFRVYAVPTAFHESITVFSSLQKDVILQGEVRDITGRICYSLNVQTGTQVNLGHLSEGLYFLRVNNGKYSKTLKLLKY